MRQIPVYPVLSLLLIITVIATAGCLDGQDATAGSVSNIAPKQDWRIDHAVVVVTDLAAATDGFCEAGFTVVPGGEHTDGATHNALISFEDGSYLELFAPVDPATATRMQDLAAAGTFNSEMNDADAMQKRFMLHLAAGAGLADFAISYPGLSLSEEQVQAGERGTIFAGPFAMSRTGDDGTLVKWHVLVPESDNSASLPFLIEDETARSLRVPSGNATVHSNGVTGIRCIGIATKNTADVTTWYHSVLGTLPDSESATMTSFPLAEATLIIRETTGNEAEGPTTVIFDTDTGIPFSLDNVVFE